MTDFKTALINLLEGQIPELKNKIQAEPVDTETPVPYAVCLTPQEVPIRTIHGIVGYFTTFEVLVYHARRSETEKLKHKIIKALDMEIVMDQQYNYKSSEYTFHPDVNIHGYSLTFRMI